MTNVARLDQNRFRKSETGNLQKRGWVNRLSHLTELDVSVEDNVLWTRMLHKDRASASFPLLSEMLQVFKASREGFAEDQKAGLSALRYQVLSSNLSGVFLLGGDLPFFAEKIEHRDRASLLLYALECINVVHGYANGPGVPVHTIALVQGDCLGGGFEAALANDVIIAEKSAKFGLPEVLFNLFPGMGAYTLLARKLDVVRAERMIFSGKLYTADEMHEMGLVDVVAEDGEGEFALHEYIERHERHYTSRNSIMRARQIAKPVSYDELKGVVEVWVDAAMSLAPGDLRKMQLVSKAQDRRLGLNRTPGSKAVEIENSAHIHQLTA